MTDNLTPEQRRKAMKAIKSKGTKPELALQQALNLKGLSLRKHQESVVGRPDFSFKKYKIAVFVDGELWHGKDWEHRKGDHKSNIEFWHKKIERNMKRDAQVNEALTLYGWTVLRFWSKDVLKNPHEYADKILFEINEKKANMTRNKKIDQKNDNT